MVFGPTGQGVYISFTSWNPRNESSHFCTQIYRLFLFIVVFSVQIIIYLKQTQAKTKIPNLFLDFLFLVFKRNSCKVQPTFRFLYVLQIHRQISCARFHCKYQSYYLNSYHVLKDHTSVFACFSYIYCKLPVFTLSLLTIYQCIIQCFTIAI